MDTIRLKKDSEIIFTLQAVRAEYQLFAAKGVADPEAYLIYYFGMAVKLVRNGNESAAELYARVMAVVNDLRLDRLKKYGCLPGGPPLGPAEVFALDKVMNKRTLERLAHVEKDVQFASKPPLHGRDAVVQELLRIGTTDANVNVRLAALCKLFDMLEMAAPKRVGTTATNHMLVPMIAALDDWELAAEASQMQLRDALYVSIDVETGNVLPDSNDVTHLYKSTAFKLGTEVKQLPPSLF
ncbi:hypothetical protein [Collimonas pratensis]|uniref:Uncharacterized protein n=1 Tax=Collimonas pratensis TaxID=279113 RepID=A0A127Q1P9_9BURK|nr:hypothetical protein [Collimonas pratensis]AMP03755.1 hypothetical protein CPter91_1374 [Collimonas pratensis]